LSRNAPYNGILDQLSYAALIPQTTIPANSISAVNPDVLFANDAEDIQSLNSPTCYALSGLRPELCDEILHVLPQSLWLFERSKVTTSVMHTIPTDLLRLLDPPFRGCDELVLES
jgi:hypothetical protein